MKKMLSNLLELPAKIDEDIHRQYSKLTKRWEDKGYSRYSLSMALDSISPILGFTDYPQIKIPIPLAPLLGPLVVPAIILWGCIEGFSITKSLNGLLFKNHSGIKEQNGKYVVSDPVLYFGEKLGKTIRAPELILGASFIGKGVYEIYNSFANQDASSLSDGLSNLSWGVSLASNASAWYVRDSDPKVLDKKPNWKVGLEKLMEYVSPAQTEHSPIKVPVKY